VAASFAASVVTAGAAAEPASPARWWVYLADKGPTTDTSLPTDERPLYAPYVAEVGKIAPIRNRSRWFNAVSVTASADERNRLLALACVRAIEPVGRYRRATEPESEESPLPAAKPAGAAAFDYGSSTKQIEAISAQALHTLDLSGEGVTVAVFDDGFGNVDAHPALAHLNIAHRWDFVGNDGDPSGGVHGTQVLSVMAAFQEGAIIGPAYGAPILLARTEAAGYERPVEEDNWVAAAEWADSLGARVIQSSVGYNYFKDDAQGTWSQYSYTIEDLDGKTALITRAAQKAASKGIVVVVAAGNERGSGSAAFWHGKILMPGDGDSVIAVGATNFAGYMSPNSFSSVGPAADGRIKPDVSAPGLSITAVSATSTGIAGVQGTSFASPLVAGVVALLLEGHPDWDPINVRTALRFSADRSLAPDTTAGWGMISAKRAFDADVAVFGRAIDRATGQPVSGAYVRLYGGAQTVAARSSTNESGWFSFERLEPGTYTVSSYLEFGKLPTDEIPITVPAPPRELRLDLADRTPVSEAVPTSFWLGSPRPNPANPTTTIRYRIPAAHVGEAVHMRIVSISGQAIRDIRTGASSAGSLFWDGTDERGIPMASGVYVAFISFRGESLTRRMTLLR